MKKNFKFLIGLLVGCMLFTGCGKSTDGVDKRINLKAPDGVKVETYYSEDKSSLIVKLSNETSSDINVLDVVATYPGNGDILDEDEKIVKNIDANSYTYVSLLLPIDEDFNSYIPNKIDLNILTESESIDDAGDTSMYKDFVKLDYKVENDEVNINLTNDTGKILGSIEGVVIYFKDGKPIAADDLYALDVDDNVDLTRDILSYDDTDEVTYIDYDNVEVYLTNIIDDYIESEDEIINEEAPEDNGYIEEDVDEDIDEEWD